MPGVTLNLSLPSVGDTMAVVVAKTAAALSAIQDDLAPKVVASELNINASLSFNGNLASGLSSIGLIAGNPPSAAGSIYYSAGEFFAIDNTGVVKLTSVGQIAVAGVKGIGGDYGNIANAALVYYDNISGQYRFFNGTGTAYGSLASGSLILKNPTLFGLTIQPSATQATNITYTMPPALPAAAQLLTVNSAGVIADDGVLGTNVNVKFQGTGYVQRGNRTRSLPFTATGIWNFGSGSLPGYVSGGTTSTVALVGSGTYFYPIILNDANERLLSVTVYLTAVTTNVALALNTASNSALGATFAPVTGATGSAALGGITRTVVLTPTTPATVASTVYWVSFNVPATGTANVFLMDITTDVP